MYHRDALNALNPKGFRATARSLESTIISLSLSLSVSPSFPLLSRGEKTYVCTCTRDCVQRARNESRAASSFNGLVSHGSGWVAVGISTGCLPPVCLLPFTAPSIVTHRCRHRRRRCCRHHHRHPSPTYTASSRQSTNRGTLHAL